MSFRSNMFITTFVLFLSFNLCSCNQEAADAIQQSLFGGIAEPEAMAVYGATSVSHASSSRHKAKTSQSYSFQDLSRMNVQRAPGQQTYYRPSQYENIPVIESCPDVKCHLTIALVLDSSGSVGYQNFLTELGFVKTLLEILTIKASDEGVTVCAGVVVYSTKVFVPVNPCCQNSMCRVVDQFSGNKIPYKPGATNTNGALKVARQVLQSTSSYKKVALLITDGKSNVGGSPIAFAEKMRKEDGIDIVALGVTDDVKESELKGISGYDVVTMIDYFDEFHELANLLLEANYLGSEYELMTTFEAICSKDNSEFSSTCAGSEEEEEDDCAWGNWSNCIRKLGKCTQSRTCKLKGGVANLEERACKCEESARLMHQTSWRLPNRHHIRPIRK